MGQQLRLPPSRCGGAVTIRLLSATVQELPTYLYLRTSLRGGKEERGSVVNFGERTLPSTHTSLLQRLESFVLEWVAHQNCAEAGNCRYSLEGQSLLDQSFTACSALSSVLSVGIPRLKQWTPVFGVWFKDKHNGVLGPHVRGPNLCISSCRVAVAIPSAKPFVERGLRLVWQGLGDSLVGNLDTTC